MPLTDPHSPAAAPPLAGMSQIRKLALVACSGLVLVVFSIWAVDRPVAVFAHTHLRSNPLFGTLTHLVDPIPPLATVLLIWFTGAYLVGRPPSALGWQILRFAIAVAVALFLKEQLKILFGRTWPETWVNDNPSYIRDGVFEFRPLAGGRGYMAFPSGHATLIAVSAVVIAQALPWTRWICAAALAAVVIGQIGANYHWTSDLIAGLYLGAAVGYAASLIGADRPTR